MKEYEIIEMARESGLETQDGFSESVFYFAKLVAERECEACAKVCEDYGRAEEMQAIGNDFAQAIRARGQA